MNSDSSARVLPSQWRTMRSAPASGAYNMAVDSVLHAAARDAAAGAVWRTYAWDSPTISFGRNESARTSFSDESLAAAGMTAVRRPTGGRALLHANEVTYSVTMPLDSRTPWTVAYRAVNAVLVIALRALGVDAHIANTDGRHALKPDGALCFAQPDRGEIVVDDHKLVGSAVWRDQGAYLQHGSILIDDRQTELLGAMRRDHTSMQREPVLVRAATLKGCVTRVPTWSEVASALESALRDHITVHVDGRVDDTPPILDADALADETRRLSDAAWLWRR